MHAGETGEQHAKELCTVTERRREIVKGKAQPMTVADLAKSCFGQRVQRSALPGRGPFVNVGTNHFLQSLAMGRAFNASEDKADWVSAGMRQKPPTTTASDHAKGPSGWATAPESWHRRSRR